MGAVLTTHDSGLVYGMVGAPCFTGIHTQAAINAMAYDLMLGGVGFVLLAMVA